MSYLTFEYLDQNQTEYRSRSLLNEINNVTYAKTAKQKVFLSHKHDENTTLITQVRGFFLSLDAELYIDWMDEDMPRVTNPETAQILKTRIASMSKFVLLATPRSIESIWIPWELGIADKTKGLSNIAILPVIHSGSIWERREYYGLYSRIEKIGDEWKVIEPKYSAYGVDLLTWLKS